MSNNSTSSHPHRLNYPDEETDLLEIDPNIAQKVTLKHGFRSVAYNNEFWVDFWPRMFTEFNPKLPYMDDSYKEIDIDVGEWCHQWKNFQARTDDVFISSFPKSGHHWLFEVVHMIMSGKTHSQNRSKLTHFCEARTNEELDKFPSPRLLLSHVKHHQMPQDVFKKGCKIIYVYRNPKDVAVSYFHHVKGMPTFYNFYGDWHQYLELTMAGLHEYGRWLDNVPGWWKHGKGSPNILFLSYEQIKKNFKDKARTIAEFLGKCHSDDFYQDLEKACSIEAMKANARNIDVSALMKDENDKTPGLIRKGVVGDWKNHFTVAESEQFDAIYQPVLDQFPLFPVEYE